MKKIVVAGIPRSGTTMVFRALAGLPQGSTTPKDYDGPIVKTHSFKPDEVSEPGSKAVFLFGNPVHSVLSTKRTRYTQEHFANCGAVNFDPARNDILDGDFLNCEKMFEAWNRRNTIRTLCLRYERLHQYADHVAIFVGFPIAFPKRIRRKTLLRKADPKDIKRIAYAYASLIEKIHSAPDLAIF